MGCHADPLRAGENGAVEPETASRGAGPVDESVRERPGDALRPLVGWYSGYRQAGVPPMRHRGLPTTSWAATSWARRSGSGLPRTGRAGSP